MIPPKQVRNDHYVISQRASTASCANLAIISSPPRPSPRQARLRSVARQSVVPYVLPVFSRAPSAAARSIHPRSLVAQGTSGPAARLRREPRLESLPGLRAPPLVAGRRFVARVGRRLSRSGCQHRLPASTTTPTHRNPRRTRPTDSTQLTRRPRDPARLTPLRGTLRALHPALNPSLIPPNPRPKR